MRTKFHTAFAIALSTLVAQPGYAQPEAAPPEEEVNVVLKKGQKITMVACNWAGHPEVVAHYEGTFK